MNILRMVSLGKVSANFGILKHWNFVWTRWRWKKGALSSRWLLHWRLTHWRLLRTKRLWWLSAPRSHAFGPVLAVRSSPNTLESAGVLNITLKRTRDLDDVHHDSKLTHRHDRLRLLSWCDLFSRLLVGKAKVRIRLLCITMTWISSIPPTGFGSIQSYKS